jgi:adenylate cyclase
MATEIEHTFLVAEDDWRDGVRETSEILQGYLHSDDETSIRVRLRDGAAVLTVKRGGPGREREEVEVPLPTDAAEHLLDEAVVGRTVRKRRHLVDLPDGLVAEVDEFLDELAGLVLVEVELPHTDAAVPDVAWFGAEVTEDERYYNASLARDGVPAE